MPPKTQAAALGKIEAPKNSLTAFKTPASPKPDLSAPTTTPTRRPKTARAGRPAKSAKEKESATVILKMTEADKQKLLDKAGITPLGTWFKHFLKTETDIFK